MSIAYESTDAVVGDAVLISDFACNYRAWLTRFLLVPTTEVELFFREYYEFRLLPLDYR